MNNILQFDSTKQYIITQISENEFLLEGYNNNIILKSENYDLNLISAKLSSGLMIHIGDNFLGYGKINEINLIDSEKDDYIMLKLKVNNNESIS